MERNFVTVFNSQWFKAEPQQLLINHYETLPNSLLEILFNIAVTVTPYSYHTYFFRSNVPP